jgi:hypothetical protein
MDRDDFIITVYCLVCEHYHGIAATTALRRGGFAPAFSALSLPGPRSSLSRAAGAGAGQHRLHGIRRP